MNEFAKQMLEEGQKEIDTAVESYADALGTVNSYTDAEKVLLSAYKKRSLDNFAHLIDEVRFASQGVGASTTGKNHA